MSLPLIKDCREPPHVDAHVSCADNGSHTKLKACAKELRLRRLWRCDPPAKD